MALNEKTLEERYGRLQPLEKIRKMIEDMVDTDVVIEEVKNYGARRYLQGSDDGLSRANSRPGFGDMGG